MSELEIVLNLLRSEDPEEIREGAHIAGGEGYEEAVPLLVAQASSNNIGVQEAVERALYKIGGPKVVHAMIPLLRSDDAPVRNTAMELLRRLGSCDVESLTDLLRDEDVDIRIFASDILGSVGSSLAIGPLSHALLQDPEVNVRYQAAVSLGELALPEAAVSLNKALHDEEWVQFAVIEALTKIRAESSIGALLSALGRSSDLVASMIVEALGEMGNMRAVPILLKHLEMSPGALCNKIVRAIVNILGEQSLTLLGERECSRLRAYIPAALKDEDPDVQDAAVKAFAALGNSSSTTLLLDFAATLNPESDSDRLLNVLDALMAIGYNDSLEKAVIDGEDLQAHMAVEAMSGLKDERSVPLLIGLFWAKNRDMQRFLIGKLAHLAGRDRQDFFVEVLERHKDGNVIRGALQYMGLKGEAEKVQGLVLSFLEHKYSDVRSTALDAAIALRSDHVRKYFQEKSKDADPVKRLMSVYAFGCLGPGDFMPELEAALGDVSADVRKVAVESLANCSHMTDKCKALIESKIEDDNKEVRLAVVETLALHSGDELDDYLVRGLEDEDPWVRVRCIEKIGEKGIVQGIPKLMALIEQNNQLVTIKAIDALGMIGGEVAFRALMALLDYPDSNVQLAAEESIEHIRRQSGE